SCASTIRVSAHAASTCFSMRATCRSTRSDSFRAAPRRFLQFPNSLALFRFDEVTILNSLELHGAVRGRFRTFPRCTVRIVHDFGFLGATRRAWRAFPNFSSLYRSVCSRFWIPCSCTDRLDGVTEFLFVVPFEKSPIPFSLGLYGFPVHRFGLRGQPRLSAA